jgi:hypothetical protein
MVVVLMLQKNKDSQHLKKYPDEYNGHAKDAILAKLLDRDKDDLVYWYVPLMR